MTFTKKARLGSTLILNQKTETIVNIYNALVAAEKLSQVTCCLPLDPHGSFTCIKINLFHQPAPFSSPSLSCSLKITSNITFFSSSDVPDTHKTYHNLSRQT